MRQMTALVLAAWLGVGLVGHARAADNVSAADKRFIIEAAQQGLAQLQVGQLAVQKGQAPSVQQYGKMLVTDHTLASQDLAKIAEQEGLTLPIEPNLAQKTFSQHLSGLSGPQFDKSFAQHAVLDDQSGVAAYRKEAQSGTNPALKSFAQKYLPTLQTHLQQAQALRKSV